MSRSFAPQDLQAVLAGVEATEPEWVRDARTPGEEHMVPLLNEFRAAWALIRQWTGHDRTVAVREQRNPKSSNAWFYDAIYALQKAGLDSEAVRLRDGHRPRGVLCDLTDAAMGMAFASTLAPEQFFTTVSITINFFRQVWQPQLRAEARVTSRGRNIGYIECEVTDEAGKHLAKAASTCFVLRGEQVKTR